MATIDYLIPSNGVLITNSTGEDKEIALFPAGGRLFIKSGDSVKLSVSSSEAYVHYAQACDDLGLTYSAIAGS